MKKIIFLFLIAISITFCANAQNDNSSTNFTPSNVIKTAPLGFLVNYYQLSFESAYKPKRSWELTIDYYRDNNVEIRRIIDNKLVLSNRVHQFSLRGNYRFYTSKKLKAAKGFYFGPHAAYTYSNIEKIDIDSSTIYVGGVTGYQFILGKKQKNVTIDLLLTPSYGIGLERELKNNTFNIDLGIKLGFRYPKKRK